MAVNGKQKGSSFERKICVDLSLWLSGGNSKDLFWRSAMSGGRSTVAMKKGEKLANQAGDVSAVHELGHRFTKDFYVECKFYKSLNFESLIKGKGKLLDFWKVAQRESRSYGKEPILIGKQNQYPIVACLTTIGADRLSMQGLVKMRLADFDMNIVLWDDYLKCGPRTLTRVRL